MFLKTLLGLTYLKILICVNRASPKTNPKNVKVCFLSIVETDQVFAQVKHLLVA